MKAKNKKVLIAGAAIVAAAAGIFLIARRKREVIPGTGIIPNAGTGIIPNAGIFGTSPNKPVNGITFPLQLRSGYSGRPSAENQAVKTLQRNLNMKIALRTYLGLSKLTVDGKFGPKTEAASQKVLGVKQVSYTLYKQLSSETQSTITASEGFKLFGLTMGLS